MGNIKAEMFNKKAANPKYRADEIIKSISLKPGSSIADIGSGGGYFAFRFAKEVGEKGKVYCIDTNEEFLKFIKDNAIKRDLHNIITVLAESTKIDIGDDSLDFVFMRNVTHHMDKRIKYFKNLKELLKPKGAVIIIDYKKNRSKGFHTIFRHYISKEVIETEMNEAGYYKDKEFDFLPEQHFTIYLRKNKSILN